VRRILAVGDGDALDTAIGAWLLSLPPPPPAPRREPPTPRGPWRAVAVDGKTLRGSGPAGSQVHLLAVMDHTTSAVLAQRQADGKSNETTAFRPLLERIDLTRTVLTADAMHTQREHVEYLITTKQAAYLCIVKGNQPHLHRRVKALPWRQVPVGTTPAAVDSAATRSAACRSSTSPAYHSRTPPRRYGSPAAPNR
jgi:hypothetical protein